MSLHVGTEDTPRRVDRYAVVTELGQSIWLDFLCRAMIRSGELATLVNQAHLRGVTSNPAIFEKAIGEGHDYDAAIRSLGRRHLAPERIYERLVVEDVRNAADLFAGIYHRTNGRDGYVSLEVSPHLARDTEGTVREACRLWGELDRPNVMIKVPGTREGLPAIRRLVAAGVNVNVTLLFSVERYRDVVGAYIAGLEDRAAAGQDLRSVASVASFFLSRIDTKVDRLLAHAAEQPGETGDAARRAHGRAAIACAKLAYVVYAHLYDEPRFRVLAGARPQRLLWASTSTKDPAYSDVRYVDALIGPNTVTTVPLATLEAYADHGSPAPRLTRGLGEAADVIENLHRAGVDLGEVTASLEEEGIEKFVKPFDALLGKIARVLATRR
jgi:transaldolase